MEYTVDGSKSTKVLECLQNNWRLQARNSQNKLNTTFSGREPSKLECWNCTGVRRTAQRRAKEYKLPDARRKVAMTTRIRAGWELYSSLGRMARRQRLPPSGETHRRAEKSQELLPVEPMAKLLCAYTHDLSSLTDIFERILFCSLKKGKPGKMTGLFSKTMQNILVNPVRKRFEEDSQ